MNLQAQDFKSHEYFHVFNSEAYYEWLTKLPDKIILKGDAEMNEPISEKTADLSPRSNIRQAGKFNLEVPKDQYKISAAEQSILKWAYFIMFSTNEQFYWQHRYDGYNFSPNIPF